MEDITDQVVLTLFLLLYRQEKEISTGIKPAGQSHTISGRSPESSARIFLWPTFRKENATSWVLKMCSGCKLIIPKAGQQAHFFHQAFTQGQLLYPLG